MTAITRSILAVADQRASTSGKTTFIASTDGEATDGLIIEVGAWETHQRFNPAGPVLWAHTYDLLPLGTATVHKRNGRLEAEVTWDTADPFAAEVARKVKAGVLSAMSVGFRILEQVRNVVKRAELLELSIVPVGSDPGALAIARSASLGKPANDPLRMIVDAIDKTLAASKRDAAVAENIRELARLLAIAEQSS